MALKIYWKAINSVIMSRNKTYDRNLVLEMAMHAFWKKGYSATSINDLVKETGLNRFSLYSEFENKDKLYMEAFRNYQLTVIEGRMQALEESQQGKECLREFFSDYIRGVKNALKNGNSPTSCLSVHNATERIGKEAESSKTMNNILARMRNAFEAVLQRALKLNEINSAYPIKDGAIMLVGCTYGIDILAKFLPVKELNKYVNQVLNCIK